MATIEELDALLEEIDKLEKSGNWVEDRKEILKNITHEEIVADVMRLQAEHPERFSTPEEIWASAHERMEEPRTAARRAQLANA